MNKTAKIVFWGTPKFAIPSFELCLKSGFEIVAVITKPDEPSGRKQILTPPPLKLTAQKYKIPVFQPSELNSQIFKSEVPETDIFIIVAYGKIIPQEIIELPVLGTLNLHPSLLPHWRGPSPIQYTILHGDQKTGVTIMKVDELMDHGPILAQKEINLTNIKIYCPDLHDQLAKLGAELLVEILPQWISGEIKPTPQDDSKATFSKILKKDDGRINWSQPAEKIERMIRAFNPWPGTWSLWPSENKIYRIRIEAARTTDDEPALGSAGYVWRTPSPFLAIKTGKGSLIIEKLTLEGKKTMTINQFIRGYSKLLGSTLI